ncbi:MAG: acid phosphatase AphA [Candidatus Eisenbacteria bacterium]|nr:acid phosphatase AphA [Candidatus Latescibacterota bacterium]MBD3301955.1 acid phosphatase AphA [Candidatus Eisenbacteria bacterium]
MLMRDSMVGSRLGCLDRWAALGPMPLRRAGRRKRSNGNCRPACSLAAQATLGLSWAGPSRQRRRSGARQRNREEAMPRSWILSALVIVTAVAGCGTCPVGKQVASDLPPSHYQAIEAAGHDVITIEELATSLPDEPMVVGFDVDDTVLFSSPGFFYAFTNTRGPGGANEFGEDPLDHDEFWIALNRRLDDFSMPKRIAVELIDLHKERGDEIHFITARPCPSGDPAPLTQRLNELFGLDNEHPVAFTNHEEKTDYIRERRIALYYGDSDGDMRDAKAAGIRAIRVVRSPLSTNPSPNNDGTLGEEVLFDSEH